MWPFNTGDCLIEVTAWADLTVVLPWYKYLYTFLWFTVYNFAVTISAINLELNHFNLRNCYKDKA